MHNWYVNGFNVWNANLFCLLILHSAKIIFPFSIKPVSQVPAVPTTKEAPWLNQNNELLKKQVSYTFSEVT